MTTGERTNLAVRIILLAVPPAMGVLALALGQDASWDLRNYHFYNPFAFLTHRMGQDIAMAQVATYYNPLFHLPFYWGVTHLPPKAMGFLLGLLSGLNIFLLYALARQTIGRGEGAHSQWWCLGAALLGLLGAGNLSEVGTSFGDNVLSLLVLASLWLLARQRAALPSGRTGLVAAAAAGLLAGAAFGLKQPYAIYAVGLCAAFFGLRLTWRRRFSLAFVFGLGVLAGMAMTGGFWMLELWHRFQNPLFPYFNQFFHSPWGAPAPYRDERFLPKSWGMQLLFPIWFMINPLQVAEVPLRDPRFALLYLALVLWAAFWIAGRLRHRPLTGAGQRSGAPASMLGFMTVFMGVTFVVWMKLFSIYRYLMVGEMLAPLVLIMIAGVLGIAARPRNGILMACILLVPVIVQPPEWGRTAWGDSYFGVQAPPIEAPAETIVLAAGVEPMAYMIPFFPPQVRFLRIQSYFTGPSTELNGTDRLMHDIVSGHQGAIFVLYRDFEESAAQVALEAYGLARQKQGCLPLMPSVEPDQKHPFLFCPVSKEEK